jgi:DNA polymerase-3 subunit delta
MLPPTTRLVFVEEETIGPSHPILKVAREEGKRNRGFVRLFRQLKQGAVPSWIQQRVQTREGSISREAMILLASLVGNDLRLLDQEIEKLLLYVDGSRITTEDVNALVSRARETSIFDLVDCIGRRQTGEALKLLHRLLDDEASPLYLFAMLARQIRILIQVSELQARGLSQKQIADRLKLHPYAVEKGLAQAREFEVTQLEAAHQRLVDTDWSIKTGRMVDVLALDLLVTDLTRI